MCLGSGHALFASLKPATLQSPDTRLWQASRPLPAPSPVSPDYTCAPATAPVLVQDPAPPVLLQDPAPPVLLQDPAPPVLLQPPANHVPVPGSLPPHWCSCRRARGHRRCVPGKWRRPDGQEPQALLRFLDDRHGFYVDPVLYQGQHSCSLQQEEEEEGRHLRQSGQGGGHQGAGWKVGARGNLQEIQWHVF